VLGRADWAPNAVLVIDETGLLKKGRRSAGVARQYRGTAGRIANGQSGGFLGYASPLGHALLARERYLPEEWTDDRARCRRAGLPDERRCATTPQRARPLLARAFAAGAPAKGGTGDSVSGDARRRRMWLEAQPQADVLAVSGQEYGWVGWQQRQVKPILAALPDDGWTRLSAGDGATGRRWDDWRWWPLADPLAPRWRRWLLVRRRVSDPTALRASVVFAPQETTVAEVVRVAGARWVIEQRFEAAKGEVGLDHDEVRSWTGWSRPLTLAMWALALWTVWRAGASAVEALKKRLPLPPEESAWASFKARRGLASRCASRNCDGAAGLWAWCSSRRPNPWWPGRPGAAGITAGPSSGMTSVAGHWRHEQIYLHL
jgi:SRSO17 transposase